ncbi:hypothetical protein [Solwaraspora sp. WMMA2065]|uniref:hypothetical protein n=1 Tax=Solwaraspora sp. WMMA2065 TaxID=3015166 RepID=UPI00259B45C9|nr:hypothetical protein [Solwaraspora sp. WMMA2065]WJK37155.1 hypothetical protein O7610_12850 [Solwaraspora sp. WMMA2065]
MEAYDAVAVVRATGRWPWIDPKDSQASLRVRWNAFGIWAFASVVRVAAGGGTAAAAAGQLGGELAAFGLGVAGPLALERLVAVIGRRVETPAAVSAAGVDDRPDDMAGAADVR